jgi:hypothetical protein
MKLPVKASYFGHGQYRKHVVLDADVGLVCEGDKLTCEEIAKAINALHLIASSYVGAYTANELKQIAIDNLPMKGR